jgi:hypothetical protein
MGDGELRARVEALEMRLEALDRELHLDTGWVSVPAAAFAANWSDFDPASTFFRARYRRLPGGLVLVAGLVKKAAGLVAGETVLTLPPGFRPAEGAVNTQHIFACASLAGYAEIRVTQDGAILLQAGGSAVFTSLDGIVFMGAR